MASALLNTAAVARRSNDEAGEILKAYIETNPSMALNHTAEPAVAAAPKGSGGAVDPTRG
jgi:hypothetical protein